jgi:hypothetical protein
VRVESRLYEKQQKMEEIHLQLESSSIALKELTNSWKHLEEEMVKLIQYCEITSQYEMGVHQLY